MSGKWQLEASHAGSSSSLWPSPTNDVGIEVCAPIFLEDGARSGEAFLFLNSTLFPSVLRETWSAGLHIQHQAHKPLRDRATPTNPSPTSTTKATDKKKEQWPKPNQRRAQRARRNPKSLPNNSTTSPSNASRLANPNKPSNTLKTCSSSSAVSKLPMPSFPL